MKENSELGIMDCENLSSYCQLEETDGSEKISTTDQINRLQHSSSKSSSFIVEMERFSHLTSKDIITPNSRITRNLSRKGSQRTTNSSSIENERDPNNVVVPSSPRASLLGTISTPEKPTLVPLGATTMNNPHLHHQITISTTKIGTGTTTPTAESKFPTKRLISFRRSSTCRTIDPRRILFIFATLSSVGTILLIYFTLSMGKFSGDENALNS